MRLSLRRRRPSTDWYSAHVYYYDRNQDDLLLEGVQPLFAGFETIDGASCWHWQRHWRLGPHVRINVRATDAAWTGRVRPLIERVIGDYLRRHPSAGGASEERDLPTHQQLARLEEEHGPLSPWHPDNSLRFAEYDRRLHVLGTPQAADMLAHFHADTTPLAFAGLDQARRTSDRFDVPVTLMFATAALGCPPIERGYLSTARTRRASSPTAVIRAGFATGSSSCTDPTPGLYADSWTGCWRPWRTAGTSRRCSPSGRRWSTRTGVAHWN